jgi:hypothetical protein
VRLIPVSKYLEPKPALFRPSLHRLRQRFIVGLGRDCFEIGNRQPGEHPAPVLQMSVAAARLQ